MRALLGRLREKHSDAGRCREVTLTIDQGKRSVTAISWRKVAAATATCPPAGRCLLRTNALARDEQALVAIHGMLTDAGAILGDLCREVGEQAIDAREDRDADDVFHDVLAYQCAQFLRAKLKAAGVANGWATVRDALAVQRRLSVIFGRRDGQSLHLRQTTDAEPTLLAIYRALGIDAAPGKATRSVA